MATPDRPTATQPPSRVTTPMGLAAVVLTLLLALAGCTSDDAREGAQPELGGEVTEPEQGIAEAGEAQLAPGAGVAGDPAFVDGDFAQIPLPTAAEPLNDATVEDDVTVQSFAITATSVPEVIEFYRGELEAIGWAPGQESASGSPPDSDLPAQIQSTWIKDGQTLLITAAHLDGDDTQLTLQLSGS